MAAPASSVEILERSRRSVAGGDSSTMRVLPYHPPVVAVSGKGARYNDADGRTALDMNMGYGPLLFGHRPDFLVNRMVDQIQNRGSHLGFPSELNAQVAEKIKHLVPSIELLRFANSGTEAIATTIRLARAFTGKQGLILFEGHYHGWSEAVFHKYHATLDELPINPGDPAPAGTLGMVGGDTVPNSHLLPWNDLDALEEFAAKNSETVAAAIMEPIMGNAGLINPDPGYLQGAKEILSRHGILLIFDEVITGFRVGAGGAQGRHNVSPDLTIVSKAMGGGVPVAAFGGRADIMDQITRREVFHGGVYSSNALVLTAADAVLDQIMLDPETTYGDLERKGALLANTISETLMAAQRAHVVQQCGPIVSFSLTKEHVETVRNYREIRRCGDFEGFIALSHAMHERDVYFHPNMFEPMFLSAAHTDEDIALFGKTMADALSVLKH